VNGFGDCEDLASIAAERGRRARAADTGCRRTAGIGRYRSFGGNCHDQRGRRGAEYFDLSHGGVRDHHGLGTLRMFEYGGETAQGDRATEGVPKAAALALTQTLSFRHLILVFLVALITRECHPAHTMRGPAALCKATHIDDDEDAK
jgi:hypothetical protein